MSDVSLDVSERAFKEVFNRITPTPSLPFGGSTWLKPIWIGVDAAIHVEGVGDVDFEDSNTFLLKELKIAWESLVLRLGIDIPTIHVGSFCVVRWPDDSPFYPGECIWEFPGGDIFAAAPDIQIKIDLDAIIPYIVSEISGRFEISLVKDGDSLALKAHAQALDVDPISIQDTFGKLPAILQASIVGAAATYVAANPPAWLIDAALGILGVPSLTDLMLDMLDIDDDIQEWLMDKLNVSIGIQNLIYQAIIGTILDKKVFDIPDPYELLPAYTADVADFGGYSDPQPAGPTATFEVPRADIVNPSASFDADTLRIRFDFGV